MKQETLKRPLTADRLRHLFSYDENDGALIRRCRVSSAPAGAVLGYARKDGYLHAVIDYRFYLLHRLVWLYVKGEWPTKQVDHINGIKDDNRIENLRDVSNAENNQNIYRATHISKTGLRGVFPHGSKWIAQIGVEGKTLHIGTFASTQEAHAAYCAAKQQLHIQERKHHAKIK